MSVIEKGQLAIDATTTKPIFKIGWRNSTYQAIKT